MSRILRAKVLGRRAAASPARAVWLTVLALGAVACSRGDDAAVEDAPAAGDEPEINTIVDAEWSPRSDRLIVTWNRGGRVRLFGVLGPDTTGAALEPSEGLRISDGPDMHASWSPDGLWVAFASTRDGQAEIYRMRPDGMQVERLTDDPAEDTDPDYSPDGAWIAFVSTRTDGAPRLHIMRADGTEVRMVSNPPGTAHAQPDWSPDGSRIALQVTTDQGQDEIWVATPEGGWGRVRRGASPAWAPNADDIFLSRGDTILVARMSSGSLRIVHQGGAHPRPSPDGRWLAFVRGAHPVSRLYALDLRSGREIQLTR